MKTWVEKNNVLSDFGETNIIVQWMIIFICEQYVQSIFFWSGRFTSIDFAGHCCDHSLNPGQDFIFGDAPLTVEKPRAIWKEEDFFQKSGGWLNDSGTSR